MYNSIGAVDEGALQNLSLVVNLAKRLKLHSAKDASESDPQEITAYFPQFLWVLRDFALQLIDTEGNKISSKTYLDLSLRDVKGSSDAVEEKNRVRRLIRHFFPERDCSTLVRPVEDERLLQNLASVNDKEVRPEFADQINLLRSRTLKKVTPKTVRGKTINGPMFLQLATAYVQAFNEGEVPKIDSAWDSVQAAELQRAYQEAISYF